MLTTNFDQPAEHGSSPSINVDTAILKFMATVELVGVEEPIRSRCPELVASCGVNQHRHRAQR